MTQINEPSPSFEITHSPANPPECPHCYRSLMIIVRDRKEHIDPFDGIDWNSFRPSGFYGNRDPIGVKCFFCGHERYDRGKDPYQDDQESR